MNLRAFDIVRVIFVAIALFGVTAEQTFAQGQGRVRGTVVDEDGNPMAGVSITVSTTEVQRVFDTSTDDGGTFAIIGMVSGDWAFQAEIDGYEPNGLVWPITQSTNRPVALTMIRIKHPLEIALGESALEGLNPEALMADMERADEFFTNRQWDEAIDGYQSLLAQIPDFEILHVQVGNALSQRGDYQEAIVSYEQALLGNPDNADAQSGIARARLSMGDFEAASADLEAAAGSLNATKEDLYNLGELEFAKGDVNTAAGWYEKASMVDPNWEKPLFKLALVALNQGDIPGAKGFFQRVVDVAPNSSEGAQAQATLNALP